MTLDLSTDPRTAPFDLGPRDGVPCLLVHGFTGTPFEMRPLGEALGRQGFRALGVRLAGHGQTEVALGATTYEDWLASAQAGLAQLDPGRPAHVLGLSIGALLALRLAADQPARVASLCLLAPAAQFAPELRAFFGLFRFGLVSRLRPRWPKGGVGLVDRERAATVPCLDHVPTRLAQQVLRTQAAGWAAVPSVRQPSLVAYGVQDRTVTEAGVHALAKALRPPPQRLVRLGHSGHLLPLDGESERLCAEVTGFLSGLRALRG